MKNTTILVLFLLSVAYPIFGQQVGNATYYSPKLEGRHTTDGSRYHPDSLTCAHKTYPLGTYLLVRNPKNNEQVIVKVTDRGPFTKRMMIDLSYSAAKTIDIIRAGIATVEVSKLNFLPKTLSLLPTILPTPQSFVRVEQMYVFNSVIDKFFGTEEDKKK